MSSGPGDGLLDAVLEALGVGVLLQRADRRVVLVNTAFIRMLGISARPAELVGVRLDATARHVRDLLGSALVGPGDSAGGGPVDGGQLRTATGQVVERQLVPITVDGEVLDLWVLRDVTGQAEADGALAAGNRALADLARLKSEFVATVSHELRTPVTSIASLSTLLDGDERLDRDQLACARAIARGGDRLLRLVDELTLLAGLESGTLPIRADVLDPATLVADRITAWQQPAAAAGVTLRLLRAAAGAPIRGDEPMLVHLLDNLVGAAVAVTPPGSAVEVSVDCAGGGWTLEVTDPGPTQAAPGSRGAGLGLIISRAIAERHGGTTAIRSPPGGGTTVQVRLPTVRSDIHSVIKIEG